MKRQTHAEVKKEWLEDPEVLAAYNDLEEEYQILREMLRARKRAGLTQANIAKEMKTTTSVVSRLESLNKKSKSSPSLRTLKRYAEAVNCVLKIKLVPKKAH